MSIEKKIKANWYQSILIEVNQSQSNSRKKVQIRLPFDWRMQSKTNRMIANRFRLEIDARLLTPINQDKDVRTVQKKFKSICLSRLLRI